MTEKVKQANTQFKEILSFIKQLAALLFTLSVVGCGVGAIVIGLNQSMLLKEIIVVFAGVCTVLLGVGQLYKTVMRK